MILTGKAKEDFEKGIIEILKQNYNEKIDDNKRAIDWIYDSNDLILLAHIIEWFDSVGICIVIDIIIFNDEYWFDCGFYYDNFNDYISIDGFFKTRQEATKQAIIKANEIYNSI